MTAFRIGTQGWSYPDWVGVFYPPGAKQEDYLPFYAGVFDTVELDTTFYHPPRPSIVRSWARHTPESFRFTAKVPQHMTHQARLSAMGEQLDAFALALEPLGVRLGPLLVQLPAEFQHDAGTFGVLERFLAARPRDVRLAVEFRHRSWARADVDALLRDRQACRVWAAWRDLEPTREVTTDFLYLRWMGHREAVNRYDGVRVDRSADDDRWHRDVTAVLPRVREVYGFFNNHWAGHSPASARDMKRRLGLDAPEPRDLWPQRELW